MNDLKFIILFLGLFTAGSVSAQLVTTNPTFPTADSPVTLIFDVSQSQDGRAAGLLDLTDDVFLWSGAGSVQGGDAFEFQPQGQSDFNAPFTPGTMTSLGNNMWSITIIPRDYFGVPDGTPIVQLGLLLKNGAGSAQTEDVFVQIFENSSLNASITSPIGTNFYDPDEVVRIEVESSIAADISFTVNGVSQGAPENGTSAFLDVTVNEFQQDVKAIITDGTNIVMDSVRLLQRMAPNIAALPDGVEDGINYIDDNTVILVLAAPGKDFVYVTGEFSEWQLSSDLFMNKTADGNRFWVQVDGLTPNVQYAFQYWVYDDEENLVRIGDPYAELILDPNNDRFIDDSVFPNLKPYPAEAEEIVSILETGQTPYAFQVTDFQRPAVEDLVVYELLIRDFDNEGSFQAVIDRMDYIEGLGVNAIELMPIMEFSGNNSWGYNTIYHTAVDKAYGTPDKFKELIDEAHSRGIAIILDIVFNHADFASPFVKLYFDRAAGSFGQPTADNPWCNEVATHPFSVFADFNHDSEFTKDFIDRVNRYWIEEFKVDGFRYDLSKGFTQNVTSDVGAWNRLDNDRVANLIRMSDEVRSYDPTAYLVLEHLADDPEEVILANEGFLLWSNMHGQYNNNSLGFANNADISRTLHLNRSGDWQQPGVMAYMESHDEQRIMLENNRFGNNSSSAHNVRELENGLNRIKAASTLLYSIPGPKLLWQYGEVGYDFAINLCSDGVTEGLGDNCRTDPKPIRLDYLEDESRFQVYKTMAAMINLKTSHPIFKTDDVDIRGGNDLFKEVILRAEPFTTTPQNTDEMSVYIVANFDVNSRQVSTNFPHTGTWYHYFSQGDALEVSDASMNLNLRPGEFRVYTNVQLDPTEAELNPFVRPNAPEIVSLNPVQGQGVAVNWTDNSTVEDAYVIFRSVDGGDFETLETISANSESYTDTEIDIDVTYTYKVGALNNNGTAESTTLSISSEEIVTGVEEQLFARLFQMYPNPASQTINLNPKENFGNIGVQLISAKGSVVQLTDTHDRVASGSTIKLDVSHIPDGMYVLRVVTDKETVSRRLIIMN